MENLTPADITLALQRCETEPIHQIGLIQPHGVMIVAGAAPDRSVLQVSANIAEFFETTPQRCIGQGLAQLIGDEPLAEMETQLAQAGSDPGASISQLIYAVVRGDILELHATVHPSQGLLIVELEPIRKAYQSRDVNDLFSPVRKGLWQLDAAVDLAGYCQAAADLVRQVVGFARVMVYRFDPNWEGEVIAESRMPEAASYLGNRFPAGDIPPQARALYTRKLIRVVADVAATGVPLIPTLNPVTGAPLDLSYSVLRAFSPVHVEYLRNMGVGASLSISILLDGKLWGLIACHHETSVRVPHPTREMLEFVAKMVSMKLASLEAGVRVVQSSRLGGLMTSLVKQVYAGDDLTKSIAVHGQELLDIVEASGALLWIDGHRQTLGQVPEAARIDELLEWLAGHCGADSLVTNALSTLLPAAAVYADVAAGLLATPLGQPQRSVVIWFREEKPRTVRWAGRPDKAVVHDASGVLRISPRKSFAVWQETWRNRCEHWLPTQVAAAEVLAAALIDAVTQKGLKQREEFYRLFGDQTPEMISRHDAQGRFIFASPSARIVLGCAPEDLLGTSIVERVVETEQGDFMQFIRKATDAPASEVFHLLHASGTKCWLEITSKCIVQADGSSTLMLISRDVTARQQFQLAAEAFQRGNLSLLESEGEGILAVGMSGLVSYANPVACELLGWTAADLIGRHAHRTIHHSRPDGTAYPAVECPSHAVRISGTPALCHDDYYFHQDGTPIRVVTATSPIINQGSITGTVVVFIRACSDAAHDAQSPLLSREVDGALMTLDRARRITSFSQTLSRMTGYLAAEAVGQSPALLQSTVHTRSFFNDMWARVEQDQHWQGLVWSRCKDGSTHPFWVSVNAISRPDGDIEQYLVMFGETTAQSSPEAQLQFQASHDTLTALPNRSYLGRRLRQAMARAARLNTRIALAFIDLDHFKAINDTLGHAAGDQFLIEIARRLKETCREEDTLARWGGDEFLVMMEDVSDLAAPAQLGERMLAALAAPIPLGKTSVIAAASIGVAVFPDHAQSTAALIEAADQAMYRAKESGRNRVVTFEPS